MKREVPESIRPQLEQISQRLWNNKAVVMVGAGFSKNASAAYPDWGQLGDKLYKLAHGKVPNGEDKAYLSLLKVAQEAEALVGRPAVDAILQSEIPDLEVAPSELHSNLLQLPWNDVFTTNYDTLLERATGTVVKHRYSTVVDQNDLPYAEKPRIIKLHGSFRSNRPLVITEEDYRVYPVEKAPFVNTVQQALLENTLVLIGFSGDDPNFLHWIGWIRDHLGNEHIQPIYLITSSQFSTAQSKLLGKRNIHVIDMSLCNLVACDDHSEGLRVFMNFLTYRNPNRLDWPSLENSYEESLKAPRNSLELKHIQNAMSEWKVQRERYPGWLILPHKNRNKLYYATEGWIGIEES
ncbi:MAG: SIR2 family protein, partial [Paraglaciecola sp.]